jgi:hypothetical protein
MQEIKSLLGHMHRAGVDFLAHRCFAMAIRDEIARARRPTVGDAMSFVVLQMLVGNRAKYLGIVFGITCASLLITQPSAIFVGLMTRTYGAITDLGLKFIAFLRIASLVRVTVSDVIVLFALYQGGIPPRPPAPGHAHRRRHRLAAPGPHHGRRHGAGSRAAGDARRTAVGAALLRADRWSHHRSRHHARTRAASLHRLRTRSRAHPMKAQDGTRRQPAVAE